MKVFLDITASRHLLKKPFFFYSIGQPWEKSIRHPLAMSYSAVTPLADLDNFISFILNIL